MNSNLNNWAYQQLQALKQRDLERSMIAQTQKGPLIRRSDSDEVKINLGSNDYLGLASNATLARSFESTASHTSSSSRLITGTSASHAKAEQMASDFWGRPVIISNSGWHANVGLLQAFGGPNILVVADKQIHASIIDGIKLSSSILRRYQHQNLDQLDDILHRFAKQYDRVVVVTEAVFSMDGSITDLAKLVSICREHPNVAIMVDEAHSIALFGEQGRGLAFEQGVADDIDILVAPLGKSMASLGAFIGVSETVYSFLVASLRPLLYSTALPPIQMEWTSHVLDYVENSAEVPLLRKRLRAISAHLTESLAGAMQVDAKQPSHIVPIIVGDNARVLMLQDELSRLGVYTQAIRPPTVPAGTARLRLSLRADLTDEHVDHIIKAFLQAKAVLDVSEIEQTVEARSTLRLVPKRV